MAGIIKLYNTLTRKKEGLSDPKENKKIKLFVCGPTVYDYAHIGHARTYIFFDFFAKYLRRLGYEVEYIQNVTDVDDKIIKRAEEDGKKPMDIADFYTKAYLEDMKSLGVDAVTKYAKATDFISEIVAQVKRLREKGYAYKIDGDGWYFDISKDKEYGKLSGRTVGQAEDAVSRIDEAVDKRNRGDFCLWKFSKAGEPTWKSELGDGRPGWHIEDTAITEKYFGPQYDIHGGGVDLKFPHHEAEIAQQESASGKKPFVKIWMHTGALLVDGKKMSKSLGNFITVREFLKKYPPEVLRLMVLSHHYRSPMDYSEKLAEQAEKNLESISTFLAKIDFRLNYLKENRSIDIVPSKELVYEFPALFNGRLADDLNTPAAISVLFHAVMHDNKHIRLISRENLIKTRDFFSKSLAELSIIPQKPEIPSKIKKLADEREQFRVSKQFDKSDRLRKEIDALGYEIEDTPQGPFLWPKNPL